MSGMNPWLWCALVLCISLLLCMVRCFRGPVEDRLVALQFAGVIVTMQLMFLVQGFNRPPMYDLPMTLAFLSFGGGMVFVRFLERWL